jgi:hypothetical protein
MIIVIIISSSNNSSSNSSSISSSSAGSKRINCQSRQCSAVKKTENQSSHYLIGRKQWNQRRSYHWIGREDNELTYGIDVDKVTTELEEDSGINLEVTIG